MAVAVDELVVTVKSEVLLAAAVAVDHGVNLVREISALQRLEASVAQSLKIWGRRVKVDAGIIVVGPATAAVVCPWAPGPQVNWRAGDLFGQGQR